MATTKPRFSITIDESLLSRINDHQRTHSMATQNKAILDLVQIGLNEMNKEADTETCLSGEEKFLVACFRNLNQSGQKKIIDYAMDIQASGLYSKDTAAKAI